MWRFFRLKTKAVSFFGSTAENKSSTKIQKRVESGERRRGGEHIYTLLEAVHARPCICNSFMQVMWIEAEQVYLPTLHLVFNEVLAQRTIVQEIFIGIAPHTENNRLDSQARSQASLSPPKMSSMFKEVKYCSNGS